MPKYMVVVHGDNQTSAHFFADFNKADNFRMDSTVSMGWEAELYERVQDDDGVFSYTLIWC